MNISPNTAICSPPEFFQFIPDSHCYKSKSVISNWVWNYKLVKESRDDPQPDVKSTKNVVNVKNAVNYNNHDEDFLTEEEEVLLVRKRRMERRKARTNNDVINIVCSPDTTNFQFIAEAYKTSISSREMTVINDGDDDFLTKEEELLAMRRRIRRKIMVSSESESDD